MKKANTLLTVALLSYILGSWDGFGNYGFGFVVFTLTAIFWVITLMGFFIDEW